MSPINDASSPTRPVNKLHPVSAPALPAPGLTEFSSRNQFVGLAPERSYTVVPLTLTDERLHYGRDYKADAAQVKTSVERSRTEYTQPRAEWVHILFPSPERGLTRVSKSKNWCGEQCSVAPPASVSKTMVENS